MTVIADDGIKLKNQLDDVNLLRKKKVFNGRVLYYDMNGAYLNGFLYKKGRAYAKLFPGTPDKNTVKGSGSLNTVSDICLIIHWTHVHENICGNQTSGQSVANDCVGRFLYAEPNWYSFEGCGGSGGLTTQEEPIFDNNNNVWVENGYTGVGGGGSDGPIDPCYGTTTSSDYNYNIPPCDGGGGNGNNPYDLYNKCTNPCIKSIVDSLLGKDIKNKVNDVIWSIYGTNPNLNLTIYDSENMRNINNDGEEDPLFSQTFALIGSKIKLNKDSLSGSSQEYIASVIIHEAMHSYLEYLNPLSPDSAQHELMATPTYVNRMESALRSLFPSLSDDEAYALTYAGLHGTTGYNNPVKGTSQTNWLMSQLHKKKQFINNVWMKLGTGCAGG